MAGQGNYVNTGSINANWGQGLSSSLSDLSRTLLSSAQAERENELALADREERKRQFNITSQLERDKMVQNKALSDRDLALRKNANTIAREKHEASQDELLRQRLTNSALNGITNWEADNRLLDQFPDVAKDAYTTTGNALNNSYNATQNYLTNPTAENLKAAEDARMEYLKYTTTDPNDLVKRASTFSNRLNTYVRENLSNMEGGLTEEQSNKLLSEVYDKDYEVGIDSISKGKGMLRREAYNAWKATLDPRILESNTDKELFDAFSERTSYKSRDDLLASENSRIEQLREQDKEQLDYLHKFFSLNKGASASKGTKAYEAIENIIAKDIGSSDTSNAIAAFNSLMSEDGVTVDGALAAIISKIDSDFMGDSFPDLSDKDAVKESGILDLAKTYSNNNRGDTPTRRDYLLKRYTPRSLDQLIRASVDVNRPSRYGDLPDAGALYDRDLINARIRKSEEERKDAITKISTKTKELDYLGDSREAQNIRRDILQGLPSREDIVTNGLTKDSRELLNNKKAEIVLGIREAQYNNNPRIVDILRKNLEVIEDYSSDLYDLERLNDRIKVLDYRLSDDFTSSDWVREGNKKARDELIKKRAALKSER